MARVKENTGQDHGAEALGPTPTYTIARRAVASLKPHPENPRIMDLKAQGGLRRSIERFGVVQLIVVNTRSDLVLSGNQKLAILQDMGTEETDVVLVDLPPDEERALMVALNNPALAGNFTTEVEDMLEELRSTRPDLFDELLMWEIALTAAKDTPDDPAVQDGALSAEARANETALSPQPYESYNYIVLLSRNDVDWTAAQEWFESHGMLRRVRDGYTGPRKSYKIGQGRVIEMREFLRAVVPSP